LLSRWHGSEKKRKKSQLHGSSRRRRKSLTHIGECRIPEEGKGQPIVYSCCILEREKKEGKVHENLWKKSSSWGFSGCCKKRVPDQKKRGSIIHEVSKQPGKKKRKEGLLTVVRLRRKGSTRLFDIGRGKTNSEKKRRKKEGRGWGALFFSQ